MTMPLNVVAIMKALPGKESELATLLQHALPHFQQEPGCQSYALLRDQEDTARFLSYEAWDNEAALQAHMKAPTLSTLMPTLETLLAEPMEQIKLTQMPGSSV
jgi:quinol monooxygenase YgiN